MFLTNNKVTNGPLPCGTSWALVIAVLSLSLCGIAFATPIQGLGNSGWSLAVNPGGDITAVVDDETEDEVIIQLQKTFTGEPDEFNLLPTMYVEFVKESADAVNIIVITDEFITNDTTVDWIDFHMELVVNVEQPKAGFSMQYIPSGDQFQTVLPGGVVLLNGPNGPEQVYTKFDFSDGTVPNEPPGSDIFRPGADSGAMVMLINPDLEVGTRIRLKEWPTIPEPAAFCLLGTGLAMFLGRRKLLG